MIKHKLINSFLPVFNGFYSTVFEPSEDSVIEHPYTYDDYNFDYDGYRNDVSRNCVKVISEKLNELGLTGIAIKFELLSSPREYNFYNDSIWVKYRLTAEGLANINKFLRENYEAFAEYIKDNYTSCDGFISSYSNDVEDWFNEYLTDKKKLEHCFGAVLQFVFKLNEYKAFDLYEDLTNDYGCYLSGWLKEGIANVDVDIEQYSKDNYINKDAVTIACELMAYFEAKGLEFDWLNYGYVENKVNKYFDSVAKHTLNLFVKNGK